MRVTARLPLVMMVPATALVLVSLAIGLYADPLMDMAARAGAGLADPSAYIEAVMGAGE